MSFLLAGTAGLWSHLIQKAVEKKVTILQIGVLWASTVLLAVSWGVYVGGLYRGALSSTGDIGHAKSLMAIGVAAGCVWLITLGCMTKLRANEN